eukprot:scaffold12484_cov90-Alexandrium_tamarense.AAC.1
MVWPSSVTHHLHAADKPVPLPSNSHEENSGATVSLQFRLLIIPSTYVHLPIINIITNTWTHRHEELFVNRCSMVALQHG